MKLYSFFRSSASFRLRIALNLKGLSYEYAAIGLRGAQNSDSYRRINPQQLVPALEDDGRVLIQSMAIIEYLDETHPRPPLLPATPFERARVRGLAQIVACEVHPLNNLRVLNYLGQELGQSEEARNRWYRHWVALGLQAMEALLDDPASGRFCHGDQPTLADICLVPQLYNARRYECDLTPYPRLLAVEAACRELAAFEQARPEQQPDAS